LLRETLGRTRLCAPVHTIVLHASRIQEIELANLDLFQDNAEAGDGNLLLERLRIRLGKEAVFSIAPAADHRPELAWRPCEAGDESKPAGKQQRPLWLLPKPMPCHKDRIELQSGPERIESGWWDGMDVARDYYVAQGRNGSRLWVFRDRSSGAWFVHGLFA
jgi:protein ImuB